VTKQPSGLETRVTRRLRGLAFIGGLAIFVIMVVTSADVFLRYVFNAPLSSNVDITQMAMVVAVFCAIAYAGWTGGHIVVDVFTGLFPPAVSRVLAILVDLVGAALMAGIAWHSWLAALDYRDTGEVSFTILVPKYPFLIVVAVGSALYAAILLYSALFPARLPVKDGQ
jgi:TRAP-type C4-dicarboxylate transport system permease small subunit